MLPPKTEAIWKFQEVQPALAGFILVGGSALALRIGHRVSEDLDLAFSGVKLPRSGIEAALQIAAQAGHRFQRADDEAALEEFLQGGLELHDYQQDFVVDGVKVSFFTPDAAQSRVLLPANATPFGWPAFVNCLSRNLPSRR